MNTSNYPQYIQQDDEIDLFELAEKLWARKLLIIAITTAVALAAVAVALLLPPTWQAETRVYRSTTADLAHLNSLRHNINGGSSISAEKTFNLYHRHLSSQATLRAVFHSSGLADIALETADNTNHEAVLAGAFGQFQKSLNISASNPKKDASKFLSIRFDSQDQVFSARLINDFLLPIARKKTTAELSNNLDKDLEYTKERLLRQINQIEQEFIEQTRLRTLQLDEALSIAKAGGIKTPAENIDLSLNNSTLFLMGSDILSTQLAIQQNEIEQYRLVSTPSTTESESESEANSDKPLLAKVAPLFLKLQALDRLDTQLDQLHPVAIDEPAMVPATPIKPKKPLIAALGIVLGGMLGVFAALIQIAVAGRKEKLAQHQNVGTITPSQVMTPQQEAKALRQ